VAGCCECGDEPSGSDATELVSYDTRCHCLIGHLNAEGELTLILYTKLFSLGVLE
jgi:hypothetical protein